MSTPSAELEQRAQELFEQAAQLPADKRGPFLERYCHGDDDLKRRVESLFHNAQPDSGRSYTSTPTLDPATAVLDETKPKPSAGLSQKPPMEKLGNYKLLEVIGEGGFGTVWHADQLHPIKRRVALKIIKPGMDSKAVIARFEQERQALAIMDHPNIAKVLDAGTAPDGRPYFVMEYVPGEPITSYCDRNRLNVDRRLDLFVAVCEAVQHAHQKGIIHRDIKPGNVLVTVASGQPQVKVIDFGVAKAMSHTLTDKTLFTEHGQILGTPEYMSPEQAEMGALDIDTRTDVYALGVLLYELLTGALPFEPHDLRSRGYNEIQRIIREVDPPRPSVRLRSLGKISAEIAAKRQAKLDQLEGQLRKELEWIPLKAMRKNRNERYASPLALADDIRNHLGGRPLVAGPESAAYRAKKFVYRNRWAVTAASLVLLALLIGAIVSTIGFVRAARNARIAERNAQLARQEAERANLEAAKLRATTSYLDSMLSSADPAAGDRKDVTVRELLENAVLNLEAGRLGSQPESEAHVRRTLARTFRSLGFFQAAELQWRKALDLASASIGPDSAEAARALVGLGQVQTDLHRYADAEKSLRRALAIQKDTLDPDDLDIATTYNVMGVLAAAQGNLPQAQAMYRDALAIFQKHPLQSQFTADAMANLATAHYQMQEYQQAGDLTRRALGLRRQRSGPNSIDVWNSLVMLGNIQEAGNDLAGAEQTRREALALSKELFEEKHRNSITSMINLARTLTLRGTPASLEEARSIAESALELARQAEGEQSITVARCLNQLGGIMRDSGQFDRSVELFRQELALRKTLQPADHVDMAAAMSLLADALTRAGKDAPQAVELATQALEIRKKAYKPDHWVVCNTMSVLGGAYAATGEFDKAEPLLLSAFECLKSGSALGQRAARDAANRLVRYYEKIGKSDKMAEWKALADSLSKPSSTP